MRTGAFDTDGAATAIDLVALHLHARGHAAAGDADCPAATADRERAAVAQLHAKPAGTAAPHCDVAAAGGQATCGDAHAGRGRRRSRSTVQQDVAADGVDRTVAQVDAKIRAAADQADRAAGGVDPARDTLHVASEHNAAPIDCSATDGHVASRADQPGAGQRHARRVCAAGGSGHVDVPAAAVHGAAGQGRPGDDTGTGDRNSTAPTADGKRASLTEQHAAAAGRSTGNRNVPTRSGEGAGVHEDSGERRGAQRGPGQRKVSAHGVQRGASDIQTDVQPRTGHCNRAGSGGDAAGTAASRAEPDAVASHGSSGHSDIAGASQQASTRQLNPDGTEPSTCSGDRDAAALACDHVVPRGHARGGAGTGNGDRAAAAGDGNRVQAVFQQHSIGPAGAGDADDATAAVDNETIARAQADADACSAGTEQGDRPAG